MKEGKSSHTAALWVAVVGGVLITAAIITLYAPWLQVFDLREIIVSGNQRVSAQDVAEASSLRSGQTLFAISLRTVSERVALLPWVRSATVRRGLPHTLQIRVTERVPVARILFDAEEACLLLGDGGVVVQVGCEDATTLPVLRGAPLSGRMPGDRILDTRVLELVERIREGGFHGVNVQEIDVSDSESVRLEAEGNLHVLLGDLAGIMSRVGAFASLCRTIDVADYQMIDLRFGGEATLVPR